MGDRILKLSMLMDVSKDGTTLILLDGSKWVVSPEYVPEIRTWVPTAEIAVTVGSPGSEWPYKIVNGNGLTAMAYRRRSTQVEVMQIVQ